MLDFVAILTKSGIALWSQNTAEQNFSKCVNNLIRTIILEGRTAESKRYEQDQWALNFKLDNELDLIFVAVYQKVLTLPYVDSLLEDIQSAFKDKYGELVSGREFGEEYEFTTEFQSRLINAENSAQMSRAPKQMRTFNESVKSKKTVASLIEKPNNKDGPPVNTKKITITESRANVEETSMEDTIMENRRKLKEKLTGKKSPQESKSGRSNVEKEKGSKKPRIWDLGGNSKDASSLEYSKSQPHDGQNPQIQRNLVGTMQGGIQDLEIDSEDELMDKASPIATNNNKKHVKKPSGLLSYFKGIVGSKTLTKDDLQDVIDKMRDHLISKNVAADIAYKLCDSVVASLEGKSVGTFETIASVVKESLSSTLLRILSPKRRIDIIRDALESKKSGKPYTIIFCGVNGVGKSTNLAKICFWLIENDFSVLIAACDTFRAGAVEQLRTHTRHLNALHPAENHKQRTMVQLYEKGYGKDAAGIAMEAIKYAQDTKVDVVLIDTAGRMQDNEPLMRSLAKLIKMNDPNLVLFVGEALVGNEAVDQLVKFNQSLADFSLDENPHIIDGIVLTKFDTIDDKVGAAISMTYITGQPIVFVGTGQTYSDLKALNVNAVVHSLMK